MAAELGGDGGGKHKGGKPKGKKQSTRIDFTPMVDLGFLLITFFMLTTTMSKPQTMEVNLPSKEKVKTEDQTKVAESSAITVILGEFGKVYYYTGNTPAVADSIKVTSFAPNGGIRDVLLAKQAPWIAQIKELKKKYSDPKDMETLRKAISGVKGEKLATTMMIKSTDEAKFKNLVDIVDEMTICEIGKYAIVDLSDQDKALLKSRNLK
jgi:biopolymer transport protein ExbD